VLDEADCYSAFESTFHSFTVSYRDVHVLITFQVQNLRERNLPISRIDRPDSLVELRQYVVNPLTPTVNCHMGTAIKHPVPDRVKP